MRKVLLELCRSYGKGELFMSKMLCLLLKDQKELREFFKIPEKDAENIEYESRIGNEGYIDIKAGRFGIEVKLWAKIKDNQINKYPKYFSTLYFVIPQNHPEKRKLQKVVKNNDKIEIIYWNRILEKLEEILKKLKRESKALESKIWIEEFKDLLEYYLAFPTEDDFRKIKEWNWYNEKEWQNGDSEKWVSMYKIFHYAKTILPNSGDISPAKGKYKYVGFYWHPENKLPRDGNYWFGIEEDFKGSWIIQLGDKENIKEIKFSEINNWRQFYDRLLRES